MSLCPRDRELLTEPDESPNEEWLRLVRKHVEDAQQAGDLAMEEEPGDVGREMCLFDGAHAYLLAAAEDGQLPMGEVLREFLLHIGEVPNTEVSNDSTPTHSA
jgi:hypothetical protein